MAQEKEEGGIGFRNVHDFNTALLAKQLWRLITQPNLLMSKVMKAKYFPKRSPLQAEAKGHSSWLWKSWLGANNVLLEGLRYQVGDGKIIKVWESPWLTFTKDFKPETKKPADCNIKWVSELMLDAGKDWNLELITRLFNRKDATTIRQIPISKMRQKDRLVFYHSNNGIYSVGSAYQVLASAKSQFCTQPKSSCSKAQEQLMWKRLW